MSSPFKDIKVGRALFIGAAMLLLFLFSAEFSIPKKQIDPNHASTIRDQVRMCSDDCLGGLVKRMGEVWCISDSHEHPHTVDISDLKNLSESEGAMNRIDAIYLPSTEGWKNTWGQYASQFGSDVSEDEGNAKCSPRRKQDVSF